MTEQEMIEIVNTSNGPSKLELSDIRHLNLFLLLDKYKVLNDNGILSTSLFAGATHDTIWLAVDIERMTELPEDVLKEMGNCGMFYDECVDCFVLFV